LVDYSLPIDSTSLLNDRTHIIAGPYDAPLGPFLLERKGKRNVLCSAKEPRRRGLRLLVAISFRYAFSLAPSLLLSGKKRRLRFGFFPGTLTLSLLARHFLCLTITFPYVTICAQALLRAFTTQLL